MATVPVTTTTVPARAPVVHGNPAANVGHSIGSVFGSVGHSAGKVFSPALFMGVGLLLALVVLVLLVVVYRYLRRGPVGSGGDGAVWPHVGSDGS